MQCSDANASLPAALVPVESRRLGALAVPPSSVFTFPRGLFGFPGHQAYALVSTAHPGFYWLQSLDEPALTFLTADPFEHFPGYALDVSGDVLAAIQGVAPADVLVLAIVTLGRDTPSTANLQGPLALNPRTGLARQFVVSDPAAPLRAPLALPLAAAS
jgi:flagellar assembly factor FliW